MASGSGYNLWEWLAGGMMCVESMGVAIGYGCKEVYRFSHIIFPYSFCICSILVVASLTFVHFL